MKLITYITLTILLVNTSCKSKKNISSKSAVNMIEFTEIISGSHSNFKESDYFIINSDEQLKKVYATINMTRKPGFSIPKIDFSKESIVCLFLGTKTTGGYAVKINNIDIGSKKTQIFYQVTSPKGVATSVITQPFYIAKTSKIDSAEFIKMKL